LPVGLPVGRPVGTPVGLLDRVTVGWLVGVFVCVTVGASVCVIDGAALLIGAAVGAWVGTSVHSTLAANRRPAASSSIVSAEDPFMVDGRVAAFEGALSLLVSRGGACVLLKRENRNAVVNGSAWSASM